MKILILGGTVFVGRHLVEAALARGHEVTLFNRGQHKAELFSEVEKLRGDRDGNLEALQGRTWDAVIDTSGYIPRIVRQSARLLAASAEHYTFISSVSVYKDFSVVNLDENSPVGELADPTTEEIAGNYGALKALCEQEVEQALPGRTLVIRPGLIVGPHDSTDRFTYWPTRVAEGGEVLAPGKPERPMQIIDVRDLAEWIIRMVEARKTGTYNATGPDYRLTMEKLLHTCKAATNSDADFSWIPDEFLLEKGVGEWIELPLWIPEQKNWPGFVTINCEKAYRAGLTFRPLAETIRDTLAWDKTRPVEVVRKAGLSRNREAELLFNYLNLSSKL